MTANIGMQTTQKVRSPVPLLTNLGKPATFSHHQQDIVCHSPGRDRHRAYGRPDAPVKAELQSRTQAGATMMEPSTSRTRPQRGKAVQLPEGGFEHPFHDSSECRAGSHQGKEHPRTVRLSGFSSDSAATSVRRDLRWIVELRRALIMSEKRPTGGRRRKTRLLL